MHAEAMLLVDDHKREIAEFDRLLEQRMGADENVDATLGKRCKDLLRARALLATAQKRDAQSGRRSEAARWS